MQDACSMLMEPHGYDEGCLMLIARNLLRLLLMGTAGTWGLLLMGTQGDDILLMLWLQHK